MSKVEVYGHAITWYKDEKKAPIPPKTDTTKSRQMLRKVSATAATLNAVSRISWGRSKLENITIFHVSHLEEHQEIFEHDFEGEEKVEQEGGAYWDQGTQNIEDDVADEVVEGDERREDIEGCPSNTEKRNINSSCWINSDKFTCLQYPQLFEVRPTLFELLFLCSCSFQAQLFDRSITEQVCKINTKTC